MASINSTLAVRPKRVKLHRPRKSYEATEPKQHEYGALPVSAGTRIDHKTDAKQNADCGAEDDHPDGTSVRSHVVSLEPLERRGSLPPAGPEPRLEGRRKRPYGVG